jgi:hypothetical protein
MRLVAASIDIRAKPEKILPAFLRHDHLRKWWGVARSLIEARAGGLYTLAWDISEQGIKYISSGVIAELIPSEYLMIRNFVYLNPDKQILGPMELEIDLIIIDEETTKVGVVQSGYQYGGDWDWYYDSVVKAWPQTLELLKKYLELPSKSP